MLPRSCMQALVSDDGVVQIRQQLTSHRQPLTIPCTHCVLSGCWGFAHPSCSAKPCTVFCGCCSLKTQLTSDLCAGVLLTAPHSLQARVHTPAYGQGFCPLHLRIAFSLYWGWKPEPRSSVLGKGSSTELLPEPFKICIHSFICLSLVSLSCPGWAFPHCAVGALWCHFTGSHEPLLSSDSP